MTLKVKVEIVGVLRRPDGKSKLESELPEESTIHDLLVLLGYREEHIRYIIPVVNGEHRSLEFKLSDGDDIVLTLPVGGG